MTCRFNRTDSSHRGTVSSLPLLKMTVKSHVHVFNRITLVYLQETFNMELTGLSSDIEYEVRLRAMNSQGWSQLSNPFLFRTAGTDQNPSPILLKTAGQ
jgi:hypothetical protein